MSQEIIPGETNHDGAKEMQRLINVTTAVYALQAASFILGITYIIAIIINYIKIDDVKGTWLESHFRWQIRTFWYSILWGAIGVLTLIILIGKLVLVIDAIWVIYRLTKGWLRLIDKKPMYV